MSKIIDQQTQQGAAAVAAWIAANTQNAAAAAMNQDRARYNVSTGQPFTLNEQIEHQKQILRDLEDQKIKSYAPTTEEMETYPGVKEAWDAYMVIRKLTLGE